MHKILGLAAVAALSSSASAAFFGFESEAATVLPDGTRVGAHTELMLSDSGITLTITRVGGGAFDIFDNDTFLPDRPPASWQTRSLDSFFDDTGEDGIGFIFAFSEVVEDFSIEFGDFGGDADDIAVYGYSDLAQTDEVDFGAGGLPSNSSFDFTASSVSITGQIRSVLFIGGSEDFPNSVFIDNISTDPVPAPATGALLALGLVGIRRRR